MFRKQLLVFLGLAIICAGLFFLLQGFLQDVPEKLTPNQIVDQIIETMLDSKVTAKKFVFSKKHQAVPHLELYHPIPQGSEFDKIQLKILRAIDAYSRSCGAEAHDLIKLEAKSQREKKLLAWERTLCGKDLKGFEAWVGQRPYMHPSGVSYAKLILIKFPKSKLLSAGNGLMHVSEKTKLSFFDQWFRGLTLSQQMRYLYGARVTYAESGLAVNMGWNGEERTIFVFPAFIFEKIAKDHFRYEVGHLSGAKRCDFVREDICFSRSSLTAREGLQALVNETTVAATVSLITFLVLLLSFSIIRSEISRRRLADAHAFVFRVISHEIRTPLTALRLHIDGLRGQYDNLSSEGQRSLMSLLESFFNLNYIIDQSLDELKGIDGQQTCHANDIVERVVEKNFKGLVKLQIKTERSHVLGSEFWISVVTKNLINNALKHGQRPVNVSVLADRAFINIVVQDEGEVSIEELRRFLKPFSKGKNSTGLGFGLSMVKQKLEEFGGELRVESQPTRFTARIPRAAKGESH